jgi:hypothetical protein
MLCFIALSVFLLFCYRAGTEAPLDSPHVVCVLILTKIGVALFIVLIQVYPMLAGLVFIALRFW